MSLASPLSHYVSGTESGLSCLRLLASVQLNSNMSESLRHLCVPPCVHCVPCLPLYVFHCAKIDSVLTQPTQGKKRIVGARLNTQRSPLTPGKHLTYTHCCICKYLGQVRYWALSDQGQGHGATLKFFSIYHNTNCQVP